MARRVFTDLGHMPARRPAPEPAPTPAPTSADKPPYGLTVAKVESAFSSYIGQKKVQVQFDHSLPKSYPTDHAPKHAEVLPKQLEKLGNIYVDDWSKVKIVSSFLPKKGDEEKYFAIYCAYYGRTPSKPDLMAFTPRAKILEAYDLALMKALIHELKAPAKKAPDPVLAEEMKLSKLTFQERKKYIRVEFEKLAQMELLGLMGRAGAVGVIEQLARLLAALPEETLFPKELDQSWPKPDPKTGGPAPGPGSPVRKWAFAEKADWTSIQSAITAKTLSAKQLLGLMEEAGRKLGLPQPLSEGIVYSQPNTWGAEGIVYSQPNTWGAHDAEDFKPCVSLFSADQLKAAMACGYQLGPAAEAEIVKALNVGVEISPAEVEALKHPPLAGGITRKDAQDAISLALSRKIKPRSGFRWETDDEVVARLQGAFEGGYEPYLSEADLAHHRREVPKESA